MSIFQVARVNFWGFQSGSVCYTTDGRKTSKGSKGSKQPVRQISLQTIFDDSFNALT